MSDNPAFLQFLERYGPPAGKAGPVQLVREVFGVNPDRWQEELLADFGGGERRLSVRSCHGPGKTALAAWLVWCMLLTRFPQKTVATAPSRGQLEDALVSEVLKWHGKLPPALGQLFEIKKNRIELIGAVNESFFSARTARAENPEALQGVHSEQVLLIADEASGVPEEIYEAAAGSMSGDHATTLLLGNPVRSTGFFFDTHHSLKHMWRTYHVHGLVGYPHGVHSPRVTPDYARDIAARYGEASNAYRVRVLGEFPLGDLDTAIPWEMIASAMGRDITIPDGLREVWGVDPARFGNDASVLVRRTRLHVPPNMLRWHGRDTMESSGKILNLWNGTVEHERPDEILVDAIGIGAGIVDRLAEKGLPVRGINVVETQNLREEYRNLRTELAFRCREWLASRSRSLPNTEPRGSEQAKHAELLAQELAAPRFKYTSSGKVLLEPKEETKKRLKRSPNFADALFLTFAGEPASLLHSPATSTDGTWGRSWSQPIRRNLPTV